MNENPYKTKEKIYEAEVLESSTLKENLIINILIKAGRTIAKPALEVLEMAMDPLTPTQVRISLTAALVYLIMPFDLESICLFAAAFVPTSSRTLGPEVSVRVASISKYNDSK